MRTSGIEPATFRLVAPQPNVLQRAPIDQILSKIKIWKKKWLDQITRIDLYNVSWRASVEKSTCKG